MHAGLATHDHPSFSHHPVMRLKVISPAQAAILASTVISLILPSVVAVTSYGFVYNDLLAHPQYKVKKLPPVAASDIGLERLQRGNDHHQNMRSTPHLDTINQAADDQVKEHNESVDEGKGDREKAPANTMIMKRPDGQQWVCSIPQLKVVEVPQAPPKSAQELVEEERRTIRRGLELLDHLSGHCLYTYHISGYWTYEYCHKKSIRQYHAVIINQQVVPENKDLTYFCGRYEQPPTEIHGHPGNEGSLQQRNADSSSGTVTELKEANDRKYLVQHWTDGDVCDLTGKKRAVEVQFQCAHVVGDRIQVVTEEKSCTYIMVINSPSLCADVAFEGIPAPEANNIDCRPIVSDDEYPLLPAAIPEVADSGLGMPKAEETNVGAQTTFTIEDVSKRMEELASEDHRSQDSILAEVESYLEALKPLMIEEQKERIKKLEDYLQGKNRVFKLQGHELFGQTIDLDTLFKPTIVTDEETETTSDNGKANQGSEEEKESQARNGDTIDLKEWASKLLVDIKKKAQLDKNIEGSADAQSDELEEWKDLIDLIFGLEDSAEAAGSTDEKATREEDKGNVKTKPAK